MLTRTVHRTYFGKLEYSAETISQAGQMFTFHFGEHNYGEQRVLIYPYWRRQNATLGFYHD